MAVTVDTIAAISTAPGRAAIAVVRASGPEVAAIIRRTLDEKLPERRPTLRWLKHPESGELVDQVLATVYLGPESYSGEDINTTAFRLIALQPLPKQTWLKLDAKVPIDWENENAVPVTAELQFGKNINKLVALYIDGLVGIGGDKTFDWGLGTGLRFKY